MSLNMEKRDYKVILAALVIPLIAAYALMGVQSMEELVTILVALTGASGLAVVLAVVAIYKGRGKYGGVVAKNLEIIGFGLAIFIATYIPHVFWHIFGLMENNPLGPGWLGLSEPWWVGFFHVGAIMFFLISSYGFYLFWKGE